MLLPSRFIQCSFIVSYQALWLSKILTGEMQLPSVLEMQEDILLQQRCE